MPARLSAAHSSRGLAAQSPAKRLERLLESENWDKVIEVGEKYLQTEPAEADRAEVHELMAKAAWVLAREQNTVEGYQSFKIIDLGKDLRSPVWLTAPMSAFFAPAP